MPFRGVSYRHAAPELGTGAALPVLRRDARLRSQPQSASSSITRRSGRTSLSSTRRSGSSRRKRRGAKRSSSSRCRPRRGAATPCRSASRRRCARRARADHAPARDFDLDLTSSRAPDRSRKRQPFRPPELFRNGHPAIATLVVHRLDAVRLPRKRRSARAAWRCARVTDGSCCVGSPAGTAPPSTRFAARSASCNPRRCACRQSRSAFTPPV